MLTHAVFLCEVQSQACRTLANKATKSVTTDSILTQAGELGTLVDVCKPQIQKHLPSLKGAHIS